MVIDCRVYYSQYLCKTEALFGPGRGKRFYMPWLLMIASVIITKLKAYP